MPRVIHTNRSGPIKIEPQEKAILICGCGITRNFPFCDGSHKACRDELPGTTYRYDADGARHEVPPPPVEEA